jgi:hypothetical protein
MGLVWSMGCRFDGHLSTGGQAAFLVRKLDALSLFALALLLLFGK